MIKGKKLLAFVLVGLLLLTAAACGQTQPTSPTTASPTTSAQPGETTGEEPTDLLENPNVKILLFGDPGEDEEALWDFFEERYGGRIQYEVTGWENREMKHISAISAGEPFDVLLMTPEEFPKTIMKKMIQPADPYFNPEDPLWNPAVLELFKWKGMHYAFGGKTEPVGIWFNVTMFENNGLMTPLEYYEMGEWTFENFIYVATELTQDTTGDGQIDQWGYSSWMNELYALANGGEFVRYNPDGTIELVWDNPKTIAGIQLLSDSYHRYQYADIALFNAWNGPFIAGKMAMWGERPQWRANIQNSDMMDEFDWAPFPVGPGNTNGTQPGFVDGWAIVNGARNPQGAAAYIRAMTEYNQLYGREKQLEIYTQQQLDLIESLLPLVKPAMYNGIGNWWGEQWDFWGRFLWTYPPVEVVTAMEEFRPVMMRNIELSMTESEIPTYDPFIPVPVIDFNSGGMDRVTTEGGYGILEAVVTSESDLVIDGSHSLLVRVDPEAELSMLVRTKASDVFLPPFNLYVITFDYKVLTDPGEEGYYWVSIVPEAHVEDWAVYFGWEQLNDVAAGDTGSFTATIGVPSDAENLSVLIGAINGGDIVLDNIQITVE